MSEDNRNFNYEPNLICDLQQFLFAASGLEGKEILSVITFTMNKNGRKILDHIIKQIFPHTLPKRLHSVAEGRKKSSSIFYSLIYLWSLHMLKLFSISHFVNAFYYVSFFQPWRAFEIRSDVVGAWGFSWGKVVEFVLTKSHKFEEISVQELRLKCHQPLLHNVASSTSHIFPQAKCSFIHYNVYKHATHYKIFEESAEFKHAKFPVKFLQRGFGIFTIEPIILTRALR